MRSRIGPVARDSGATLPKSPSRSWASRRSQAVDEPISTLTAGLRYLPPLNARSRPALTVDVVALSATVSASVLLVQRAHDPFAGAWALPGGFVEERERIKDAAAREFEEETGLAPGELRLVGVYDEPDRDPRGWVISLAYAASVSSEMSPRGGDDASAARWFGIDALPSLAFDHARIIADTLAGRESSAR
jgi:8-oxo-dGTP diphosphatase